MYDENLRPLDQDYIWSRDSSDYRRQPILLIEPTRHLMLMAAYKSQHTRPKTLAFYIYMPSFSDMNCATYRKIDGSEYVVSIRGTASASDVGVDIYHFLGKGIGHTPRYLSAVHLVQRVKAQAVRENAYVKLAGHSLGGLVAAKINCELFGGNAQTVLFSPAAQALDKDTYHVYAQPNTFIIAKSSDIVSTYAFVVAPSNSFLSNTKYTHILGDALYKSDDPFNEDAEIASLTPGQLTDLIDAGQNMVTALLCSYVPTLGRVSLGLSLTALKYYNENQGKGPVAALQWAEGNTHTLHSISSETLALLARQFVAVSTSMGAHALNLTHSPIGAIVAQSAADAVGVLTQTHIEEIIYTSLFNAPTTPFIVCFPPDEKHFESYDKIGGIKPLP